MNGAKESGNTKKGNKDPSMITDMDRAFATLKYHDYTKAKKAVRL